MRGFIITLLCFTPFVWSDFKWSSKEYSEQAAKTTCNPLKREDSKTLKQHSRTANFTELGKVLDVETCGILCCEVESCDLALFENDHCYAVQCSDLPSCEMVPSQAKSQIITFTRKSGSDVWTNGDQGKSKNAGPSDQENKTKIVTKQAAVQKSSIPEITTVSSENKGSVITLSNKENKVESPMDALLHKEVTMVRDKQKQNDESAKKETVNKKTPTGNVGEKIQDITEHYLKAEEKSDMTALQENETSVTHTKAKNHRRDLRHTLISPITIGAFTCMTVIAVSGFAMAIIKYQRERKEFEDKQTQEP